ncbi:MAG: homing endonuclease associated repeat-containing protein [Methylomonas sp.]
MFITVSYEISMSSSNFKLSRVSGQPVSDIELIADLKRVSKILNASTVSMPKYNEHGKYDNTTVARRFGSWNNALIKAGLIVSHENNISDERLFAEIFKLVVASVKLFRLLFYSKGLAPVGG